MDAKVVSFNVEKRARLAPHDPEGSGHEPAAPLRHVFDGTPQAVPVTEWQRSLEQVCYQWAAQGLHLGVHLTNTAALSVFFMTAYASALNRPVPAAESNTPFRRNHVRPHE